MKIGKYIFSKSKTKLNIKITQRKQSFSFFFENFDPLVNGFLPLPLQNSGKRTGEQGNEGDESQKSGRFHGRKVYMTLHN